jgi:hypothetical protein
MRRPLVAVAALLAAACGEQQPSRPPALGEARDLALVASGDLAPGGPLAADTRQVAVAAGRSAWLVAWSRPGLGGDDLVGLRVAPSGEPLDEEPFVISAVSGDEQSPAVAFDGERWLVVWQDHRAGPLMNVYAARVAEDGTVLDPAGIAICTREDHQRSPAVAFVDGVFVVVWADRRASTNWDVYGARVATDGGVLDPGGFRVTSTSGHQITPAIAAGPGVALAVWQDSFLNASIQAARITPAGGVGAAFPVSTAAFLLAAPAVGFDGASFVVTWQDEPALLEPDVRAARVTPDGVLLDPAGLAVASGPLGQRSPAVTFDARHAVIAWASGASGSAAVEGRRLDGAGAPVDDPPFAIASGAVGRSIALAGDGQGRVLVVHDALDGLGGVTLRGRVLTTWARLEVARAGRGAGAVTSAPAGIACGAACSAAFDAGATVTLTAAPDADSVFGGWSGPCTGTGPCTVTMDAARSVTATFLPLLAVDVTVGGAGGTVTSSPAGLSCPGTCSARFPEGTPVSLQPKGIAGVSAFSAWSGDCTAGAEDGTCTLVVDAPRQALATFLPARTLTLTSTGASAGALSAAGTRCGIGATCRVDVAAGSTVAASAAVEDAVLKAWSGCDASAGPSCTVAMSYPRTVSARIEPLTFPLTVSATSQNGGAGAVTGPGLACTTAGTAGCKADVANPPYTLEYTSVTVRAAADAGSVFKGWSGCTPLAGDPSACAITVSRARTIWGRFEPSSYVLTGKILGTALGTITGGGLDCSTGGTAGCTASVPNPDGASYATVTLRAVAGPGAVFKWWSGCQAVAGEPSACTVLVSGAQKVSARFEPALLPVAVATTGSGSGAIAGEGVTCASGGSGCTAQVANPPNTAAYGTATFRATAAPGSVFKSWTGCTAVPGDPAACTLPVSGATSISARFDPASFTVSAAPSGAGTGTIDGGGLSCRTGSTAGCTAQVPNPPETSAYATIGLRATAGTDSVFKSWTGCVAVAADPFACSLLVSGPRSVGALFEPSTLPLSAAFFGTGAGRITGAGLACEKGSSAGCTAAVPNPAGTPSYATAAVRAEPLPGSVFKRWSGCAATAGDPRGCSVVVSGPRTVTGRFEPDLLGLSVSATGPGRGVVEGPGFGCPIGGSLTCSGQVANPADTDAYPTAILRVTPDAGYVFKGWSGCTPLADPLACSLTVYGGDAVSARLEPATYPVSVVIAGSGSVQAEGISCSSGSSEGCSTSVANGAALRLEAVPAPGFVFVTWGGCTPAADGSCTVTATSARTVTASFEPSTYVLTLSFSGTGAGSIATGGVVCTSSQVSCNVSVANGATVTVQATPAEGSSFAGWAQGCTGGAACTFTMTGTRRVRASFTSP